MIIKRVSFIYFSPTGTTQKVLHLINRELKYTSIEYNLTNYIKEPKNLIFDDTDLVIWGFPVYSGRVPETFRERIVNIQGNDTPSIMIGTYGNREYNDALLEMKDITGKNGFITIGAMAVVTEHSVVRKIATGRPDEQDKAMILEFVRRVSDKINNAKDSMDFERMKVPGKRPYRRYIHVPMEPGQSRECVKCGKCLQNCPVNAIICTDKLITDKSKCIGCMRCVRMCPKGVRKVHVVKRKSAEFLMTILCRENKKTEFFL